MTDGYFAGSYWASSYYASGYWANGSSPAPTPSTDGYFADSYWASSYYASGYWANGGTPPTPPSAPVTVPASHPPHKQRWTMKPQPTVEESGLLTILLAIRHRKKSK